MVRIALGVSSVLCLLVAFEASGAVSSGPRPITIVQLQLDGVTLATLTGCDTFGSESEVIEHKVMDANGQEIIRKIPGRLKLLDLVCSSILTSDKTLANWRKQIEDGDLVSARKNGALIMFDSTLTEVTRYNFTDAWPSALKIQWNGAASTDPVTETVTIVIEALQRQ